MKNSYLIVRVVQKLLFLIRRLPLFPLLSSLLTTLPLLTLTPLKALKPGLKPLKGTSKRVFGFFYCVFKLIDRRGRFEIRFFRVRGFFIALFGGFFAFGSVFLLVIRLLRFFFVVVGVFWGSFCCVSVVGGFGVFTFLLLKQIIKWYCNFYTKVYIFIKEYNIRIKTNNRVIRTLSYNTLIPQ